MAKKKRGGNWPDDAMNPNSADLPADPTEDEEKDLEGIYKEEDADKDSDFLDEAEDE